MPNLTLDTNPVSQYRLLTMKIATYFLLLNALFSLAVVLATPVEAAGPNILLDVKNRGVADSRGVPVTATIYEDFSNHEPKVGAEVFFYTRNPRPNQYCETVSSISDAYGHAEATCYSQTPEILEIYAEENVPNSTPSASFLLYFDSHDEGDPTHSASFKEEIEALKAKVRELERQLREQGSLISRVKEYLVQMFNLDF